MTPATADSAGCHLSGPVAAGASTTATIALRSLTSPASHGQTALCRRHVLAQKKARLGLPCVSIPSLGGRESPIGAAPSGRLAVSCSGPTISSASARQGENASLKDPPSQPHLALSDTSRCRRSALSQRQRPNWDNHRCHQTGHLNNGELIFSSVAITEEHHLAGHFKLRTHVSGDLLDIRAANHAEPEADTRPSCWARSIHLPLLFPSLSHCLVTAKGVPQLTKRRETLRTCVNH